MILAFDPIYFWYVFLPVMLISLGVQMYLRSTYSRWSQTKNHNNLNGIQVTKVLFERTDLKPVKLERSGGELSDHYDPSANVVRLSDSNAGRATVAAMAVTAHEFGHVQQYQSGAGLIRMRSFLLPALQFSPMISYIAILFGLFWNMTNLLWIGIGFFALMVLFSILTLPVELDASRRGMRLLEQAGLLNDPKDRQGARQVLNAAALTYLAAAITSILQLLYYISVAQRRS